MTTLNDTNDSPKDKVNWNQVLPEGTSKKVHDEIKGVVSLRTVQRVLAGESEDNNGILLIAARIWKEILSTREEGEQALLDLKTSLVSPLKSNMS